MPLMRFSLPPFAPLLLLAFPVLPPAAVAQEAPAPRAYITNERSGDVTIIDIAEQRVAGTIAVGSRPRGIQASPDGTRIYVAPATTRPGRRAPTTPLW